MVKCRACRFNATCRIKLFIKEKERFCSNLQMLESRGDYMMEKKNYYKLFYTISIILIIGLLIQLATDYFKYDLTEHYVPFYVYIIIRSFKCL